MKKLYILFFAILISGLSFGQTPTLKISGNDAPANGSTIIDDPETAEPNNATIDFETTFFTVGEPGTSTQGNGYIIWEVRDVSDNSLVDSGNIYTANDLVEYPVTGLATGKTYFLRSELVDNTATPLTPDPVVYSLTITISQYIDVTNLASLRTGTVDPNTYYRVTGEVVNTYTNSGNTEQIMYFQDGSAGIKVFDPNYEVTSYATGDAISNIRGHLELVDGELELVPTYADWGTATTNGNTPAVSTVTITNLLANLEDYKSELVNINSVTFADGNGTNTFASLTDYSISDGTSIIFRTIFDNADYVVSSFPIPQESQNIVVIVSVENSTVFVTARSSSDMTSSPLSSNNFEIEGFNMYPNPTSLGYVNLSSKNKSNLDVAIFDVLGKQVLKNTVRNKILDVSKLNSGIYIMKVYQENTSITKKLVIE
ncbi:T9SS type A sorting domain-containing protein [Mariniflexile soesokkakense]|uniref:T9SS type A sorting domain-containing protein n=1 Tax=Mariniflexile soesokkakense TaxID=1343160 RepID=A0ABV0ACS2_9FLAO